MCLGGGDWVQQRWLSRTPHLLLRAPVHWGALPHAGLFKQLSNCREKAGRALELLQEGTKQLGDKRNQRTPLPGTPITGTDSSLALIGALGGRVAVPQTGRDAAGDSTSSLRIGCGGGGRLQAGFLSSWRDKGKTFSFPSVITRIAFLLLKTSLFNFTRASWPWGHFLP